ncbi:hypothetical protein D3C72_2595560 [compost metagenome]
MGEEDRVDVLQVRVALDRTEGAAAQVHDDLPLAFAVMGGHQIARRRGTGAGE